MGRAAQFLRTAGWQKVLFVMVMEFMVAVSLEERFFFIQLVGKWWPHGAYSRATGLVLANLIAELVCLLCFSGYRQNKVCCTVSELS